MWTNDNTNKAFGSTSNVPTPIILNSGFSLADYTYIKLVSTNTTTATPETATKSEGMVSYEYLKTTSNTSGSPKCGMACATGTGDALYVNRSWYYISDTSIGVGAVNKQNTQSRSFSSLIPYQVIGMK